jgi:7-cyano-7-deazaguanine reductase
MMKKPSDQDMKERSRALEEKVRIEAQGEEAIRPDVLMTFPYKYTDREAEVVIATEEFTALCPWTGLPDLGSLSVRYVPDWQCLELKSLKYYLLTFRSVGIVQEHVANRILADLVAACQPKRMTVTVEYRARGGLLTTVTVNHS